jgi:hypothetical protein
VLLPWKGVEVLCWQHASWLQQCDATASLGMLADHLLLSMLEP